jgi:hypothetical protein
MSEKQSREFYGKLRALNAAITPSFFTILPSLSQLRHDLRHILLLNFALARGRPVLVDFSALPVWEEPRF